jgi:hypothetical protein
VKSRSGGRGATRIGSLREILISPTSMPSQMVIVVNAPFHAYVIMIACWRRIVIFTRILIPFIRNSSRRHPVLGWR